MDAVPEERIRRRNPAPVRAERRYVLYWMIAARRTRRSFALQRAVEHAVALDRPLVVLEPLRCGYRWASDRFHRFVLDGMRDQRDRLADTPVRYHPYVEPNEGAGKGLLATLAAKACVVVTDDFPCFLLPRMTGAAARALDVRLEDVDSNGLYPMRATDRVFPTAYAFRRFLQRELLPHLERPPAEDPLADLPDADPPELDRAVVERWPAAPDPLLEGAPGSLDDLPIDHDVGETETRGGAVAAEEALDRFASRMLDRYHEDRNHPDDEAQSFLSPYLHFGHLAAHDAFERVAEAESWDVTRPAPDAKGARRGYWGMSEPAEAFLDQLVTWRELGYNMTSHRDDYDRYESLPDWAIRTLAEHAADPRPRLYSVEELEGAQTDDRLWNAAQNELVREGRIHNYLRMLWGKRILEWTESPREALEVMIELNNKYALDGRDPNSYSGIFWVLGRYDRAWGPERPVFGKVRYMSSKNTLRKVRVAEYLERYA